LEILEALQIELPDVLVGVRAAEAARRNLHKETEKLREKVKEDIQAARAAKEDNSDKAVAGKRIRNTQEMTQSQMQS